MPNYPSLYTLLTKNDMVVRVRPMRPEDAPYLVDLFENMSQDSRYSRYLQAVDNVEMDRVWDEAQRVAYGTAANTRGLLAFCDTAERPNVPVAGARYVRLNEHEAEIGVSVRDDMQNLGIGQQLLALLVDEAHDEGLSRLTAYVHNGNTAIWRILHRLDYPISRYSDGGATQIVIHVGDLDGCEDAAVDYSPESQFVG